MTSREALTLDKDHGAPGAGGTRAAPVRVCLVAREEPGRTGTSRYVDRLAHELSTLGHAVQTRSTAPAGALRRAFAGARRTGLDLNAFLASYPLRIQWPAADVYHLTVQTYATALLARRPPGPVVVTVHDVIPYLTRDDPRLSAYRHPLHRLFDWLAMRGLSRADAIIADSDWTARTLTAALGIPAERIAVVPLGVEAGRFAPRAVAEQDRRRLGLEPAQRHILYVGSEEPRKNLEALWRAFGEVRRHVPDAGLVKAGSIQNPAQRARLERLATELGIAGAVTYLDRVPDADLPALYRAADVVVMPSLYEGFGLPVLEALASGARVVCARTSSLPEVAGDAALLCEPDAPALASAILRVLREPDTAADRERRVAWARRFTWTATARLVGEVYAAAASRAPLPAGGFPIP